MTALDFEVRICELAGRELKVEVIGSPAGEGAAVATFPFDSLALENRLQSLQLALLSGASRRRRLVPEHERAVQEFGQELFETVFSGEVRSLLERSRQQAMLQDDDLRIQLRFESPELASLPWEFLYDPGTAEYLCLSRTTPVVRYVELSQPQRPLAVSPPLRVLAMVASPSDLPQLDVDQERRRIDAALRPLVDAGRLELSWLEGQTWRHLQSALQSGSWHAFHLVGHGGFDEGRGEGIVALCGEEGRSHVLGATDLGRLLGDHASLRLAVLNSCEGARSSKLDVFSSTAAVLVRRGTPAVIAMQYEITDDAAVELSRSFYAAVAAGMPVDAALGEARKAVALALPGTLEWGTPVLYLRAPDGKIFDIDPATVPPVPVLPTADVTAPSSPAPSSPAEVDLPPLLEGADLALGVVGRRWPVLAGIAAVVLSAVALLGLLGGGDDSGLGTTELAVADAGGIEAHEIDLPADSVAFVTVRPLSRRLDPDVGIVTSRREARRLGKYLAPAGFDLARFDGAFDDYEGSGVGQVIGRVDEGGADQPERILVTAPFGGRFEVVVAGADRTSGEFEVVVRKRELTATGSGRDYLGAVLDDDEVGRFLSDAALGQMETEGSVNLPYAAVAIPDLDANDLSRLFDTRAGAEALSAEDVDCLTKSLRALLADGATIGSELGPDDPRVRRTGHACLP